MKVLSLFDGISCGMVALERAGIPVERYVAYEIEPNAIKISQKNYPQIEHCGDVTTADFTQYQGFDAVFAGSPCQSLSITTGKNRTHLQGKSRLFWEFVRALEEVKPRYFLFENVASMNEESKRTISEVLGCQPIFIDSEDFSAQSRGRLYWTNIPVDELCIIKSKVVLGDILQTDVPEKYFYNCGFDFLGYDKTVCAILHINGHDILKRVNSPHAKCQTLTCVSGGHQQKKVLVNGRCRKLTPIEYERLQTLPDNYTAGVSDGARYTACGNGWTVDVIAHILTHLKKEVEAMECKN
jgi:DNA (cytosine-5)-methyltransferase 3A